MTQITYFRNDTIKYFHEVQGSNSVSFLKAFHHYQLIANIEIAGAKSGFYHRHYKKEICRLLNISMTTLSNWLNELYKEGMAIKKTTGFHLVGFKKILKARNFQKYQGFKKCWYAYRKVPVQTYLDLNYNELLVLNLQMQNHKQRSYVKESRNSRGHYAYYNDESKGTDDIKHTVSLRTLQSKSNFLSTQHLSFLHSTIKKLTAKGYLRTEKNYQNLGDMSPEEFYLKYGNTKRFILTENGVLERLSNTYQFDPELKMVKKKVGNKTKKLNPYASIDDKMQAFIEANKNLLVDYGFLTEKSLERKVSYRSYKRLINDLMKFTFNNPIKGLTVLENSQRNCDWVCDNLKFFKEAGINLVGCIVDKMVWDNKYRTYNIEKTTVWDFVV